MSVTAASGWLASGVRAGTKPSGDTDLALVVSERPASVAAAFTTNRAVCAHITACRPRVRRGSARGVVVSAGIANAATGVEGVRDAERMAELAAIGAGVDPAEMLVCCTGTIGGRIPVDAIEPAFATAAQTLRPDGGDDAARAIMTTDTRPKTAVRTIEAGGRRVTVGGMAKGAGMIAPDLVATHATLLAFLTTDAGASPSFLRHALAEALPTTFNAISVDGSTSTNDTVLLFANGASGAACEGSDELAEAVREVMGELAYAVVADGEGATKVIRIVVRGAADGRQARLAAKQIADSLLFRAAIWGGDPNWGRVVQSLGQAPVAFDPDRVDVTIGGVRVATNGVGTDAEDRAAPTLDAAEVTVEADLHLGDGSFEYLTCDLTPEYVRFNADYTT